MLTSEEKVRLERLKRKEMEPYIPLTERELKEYIDRAVDYSSAALGHLKGFTDFANSIGQYTNRIATDNLRLLDEIYYYRQELEKIRVDKVAKNDVIVPTKKGKS